MQTILDGKNQSTTWNYDLFGRVRTKLNARGTLVFQHSYHPTGWLSNRTDAAQTATRYFYDAEGNLTSVVYPGRTNRFSYDALSRMTNMVDSLGNSSFSYTVFNALASEDGPWPGDTISYGYNGALLRQSVNLAHPDGPAWTQSYGYDAAQRMTNVSSPAGSFVYTYDATRPERVRQREARSTACTNSWATVTTRPAICNSGPITWLKD